MAVRGPGQLIGERAALEVNPRSATVVALQTVVALVVSTADFAAFISTYPAVLKLVENQIFRLQEGHPRDAGEIQSRRTWGKLAGTVDRAGADDCGTRGGAGSSRLTGQNCTVVRTDVVGFGADGRDDEAHKIIKKALPAMTQLALRPVWDTCRCEDRGDGLLVIVSPDVPTAEVIERLVTMLPPQLKRHNLTYSAASRIQLRLAVGVGPIEETEFGVTRPVDHRRLAHAGRSRLQAGHRRPGRRPRRHRVAVRLRERIKPDGASSMRLTTPRSRCG